MGYVVAFAFVYASAVIGFICVIPTGCLSIDSCWFACSFIDDIATDLNGINALMKSSTEDSAVSRMEIDRLFLSAMSDISDLKRLCEIILYTDDFY